MNDPRPIPFDLVDDDADESQSLQMNRRSLLTFAVRIAKGTQA